jgi:hypothetical protein
MLHPVNAWVYRKVSSVGYNRPERMRGRAMQNPAIYPASPDFVHGDVQIKASFDSAPALNAHVNL